MKMTLKINSNKNIHNIKEQNNNIQRKFNHEQLEIEYVLCNTSIKTNVIEITKCLETMK